MPIHFVQPTAQTPLNYLPCWCCMKKSSANFIWCITYTTAKKIPVKMAAMKVIVRGRCPCRHRRTWGRFRRRESCVGSAQAVRANPIGSLIGSVGIFHFVPLGHLLADWHGIRCGQMTDEMKLKIVRNMNKAVFEIR